MAAYMGRATRTVPEEVIEDIRQQIESARHLVAAHETDTLRRYAAVTRVHVLCILRSNGSTRYSRWYRESRPGKWGTHTVRTALHSSPHYAATTA